MSTEIDRLIDTVTINFIKRKSIPINEKAVYTILVAYYAQTKQFMKD